MIPESAEYVLVAAKWVAVENTQCCEYHGFLQNGKSGI